MAQEYYHSSGLTTPSETDLSEDEFTTSSSENETGSELSSGGLTRTNTLDSYEDISTSVVDVAMNRLTNLLGRTSIGEPRILDANSTADAANTATPVLKFTLEEARAILRKEAAESKKEGVYKRMNDVLSSNSTMINSDRKGFGFKFLSLCITAAFGGRRGVDRYDRDLTSMNLKTVIPKLSNCFNGHRELNITMMCYIGHIILYYWDNEDVRTALINRFGPLDRVVGSKANIRNEIGAKSLWSSKVTPVHSFTKKRIIGEIEEKLLLDEKEFESIMLKIGIDLT